MEDWQSPGGVGSGGDSEPLRTEGGQDSTGGQLDQQDDFVAYHQRMHDAGKFTSLEWQVREDQELKVRRDSRWGHLVKLVRESPVGGLLASITTTTSRKGIDQPCISTLRLDYAKHMSLFDNECAFGVLTSYKYKFASITWDAQQIIPGTDIDCSEETSNGSEVQYATEVSNLSAMESRSSDDVAVSGERRPEMLNAAIRFVHTHGHPVNIINGAPVRCEHSRFWATLRAYFVSDGFGLLYQQGAGIQNITRESRASALEGMTVAEIDYVAAVYQVFLAELRKVATDEEYADISDIVKRFIQYSTVWVERSAAYYDITAGAAKQIFRRIHLMGRCSPDDDGHGCRNRDVLPCILELKGAVERGHVLIADRSSRRSGHYQRCRGLHVRLHLASPSFYMTGNEKHSCNSPSDLTRRDYM
jgi:hypothetical protein